MNSLRFPCVSDLTWNSAAPQLSALQVPLAANGAAGKRRQWAPEDMTAALKQARDPTNNESRFAIAKKFRIPEATLRDYLKHNRQELPRLGAKPVLSDASETRFVQYLGDRCLAAAGMTKPLANEKLKTIVQDMKKELGPSQRSFGTVNGEPGRNWWLRIKKRNPEIRHRLPSRHSAAALRAATNPATYTKFFDKARPSLRGIPMRRRYTGDEFALSPGKNKQKILYIDGTGHCEALEADGYNAHVSLMNTVCGDGSRLKTGLLFGGRKENLKLEHLNDEVVSLGYTRMVFSRCAQSLLIPVLVQHRDGRTLDHSCSTYSFSETRPSQQPMILSR
jgi:hypothetical protein